MYRVKLAISEEEALALMYEAENCFLHAFSDGSPTIMPVRRHTTGKPFILAETTKPPRIHPPLGASSYEPMHGDRVRLRGLLVPFDRKGRMGVNFRIRAVEHASLLDGWHDAH